MVTTAGPTGMIGSYNYTYASPPSVILYTVCFLVQIMIRTSVFLAELNDLWTQAGPEISIKKKSKPMYDKVNPYKKRKPNGN